MTHELTPDTFTDDVFRDALSAVESVQKEGFRFIVIMGMAKTGTTLPLTLLDGHPQLTVFPEELRFFYTRSDASDGRLAADRLLRNANTQMLSIGKTYFSANDYAAHKGTGFGERDYSRFDFLLFDRLIRQGFAALPDASARLLFLMVSFRLAAGLPARTEGNNAFACKAPHNELFGDRWNSALGASGRYIMCTRLPTEHFLSQRNVAELAGSGVDCFGFAQTVRNRHQLWRNFPENQSYILDYDKLLSDQDVVLKDLASFLEIERTPTLEIPTKMGIAWSGNSSRGIVEKGIFRNAHKAQELLTVFEQYTIQKICAPLYEQIGWPRTARIDFAAKFRWYTNLALFRLRSGQEAVQKFSQRLVRGLGRRLNRTTENR